MTMQSTLNSIRKSIKKESVSYDEIIQLESIAKSNPRLLADDPVLQEWAGIAEKDAEKPMKEYKIYGVRQYTTYVVADNAEDAMREAQSVPLHEWEPNEISGEEIHPKEVYRL